MKTALVLGTGIIALGMIRSYGQAGIRVIHLTSKPNDPGSFSKYVWQKKIVPPISNKSALLELLNHPPDDWIGALLDPAHDPGIAFIAKNYESLSRHYILATPSWKVIAGIIDKRMLYVKAHKIGVPTPLVFFPNSSNELVRDSLGLQYPCILKPYETNPFYDLYGKKVLTVNTLEDLSKKFEDVQQHDIPVMVSEIIPGPDSNIVVYISYIDDAGNVLAEMCVQKIRQHPSGFGVTSVNRTISLNEQIRSFTLQIFRNCGFSGVSEAEFKYDPRDNKYKLIEINVRHPLFNAIFPKAGINFAEVQYADKVESRSISPQKYCANIYWIHNFYDLYEIRRNLRTKSVPITKFLGPYFQKKTFAVPFHDDPIPFIKFWKRFVAWEIKRILELNET